MEPYTSILLLCPLLLISVHLIIKNRSRSMKLPPGPPGLPIIGNLMAVGDRPHESLTRMAKTYGPLMTVKMGLNKLTVVASSAEMAKEILQTKSHALSGRTVPDAVTAQVDYELSLAWISPGPEWRSLRKILKAEIMSRMDLLQELRNQMVDGMVRSVAEAEAAGGDKSVEVGSLVFAASLKLLSNTLFSVDAKIMDGGEEGGGGGDSDSLKVLMARLMFLDGKPNVSDFFPILKPFDLQRIRRDVKVCYDHLQVLMDDVIDRRLRRRASEESSPPTQQPRCRDFLDALLDYIQNQNHDDQEFTRPHLRVLLTDIFIAGTDTTSTTIEWALTELIRNPRVLQRTRQELDEAVGSKRSIKENDIQKLPYLQAVLKETFRLHPTTPFLLPHRAETDTQVCGSYTIPKDSQVLINFWAISRDPNYWARPTEFLPERFLGPDPIVVDFVGTNFSFIPFGSGRRSCPGSSLAVKMAGLTLASLVHLFDWKLPHGMAPQDIDMKDRLGITLQKATPLVLIPRLLK